MYINNNITCISPTLPVSHFLPSDIFFCSRDAGTYTFTDTHYQHYMYIHFTVNLVYFTHIHVHGTLYDFACLLGAGATVTLSFAQLQF